MFSFRKKAPLLPLAVQEQIVAAIQAAEAQTTGEVRVYMESRCAYMDAYHRAEEIFAQLKMDQTVRRNAVLVYLAVKDQQFAIMGDTEIFAKAGGPHFWEKAAATLRGYLKQGAIGEGVAACVAELGKALAEHFPYDPAVNKNELPDEIVFGK